MIRARPAALMSMSDIAPHHRAERIRAAHDFQKRWRGSFRAEYRGHSRGAGMFIFVSIIAILIWAALWGEEDA